MDTINLIEQIIYRLKLHYYRFEHYRKRSKTRQKVDFKLKKYALKLTHLNQESLQRIHQQISSMCIDYHNDYYALNKRLFLEKKRISNEATHQNKYLIAAINYLLLKDFYIDVIAINPEIREREIDDLEFCKQAFHFESSIEKVLEFLDDIGFLDIMSVDVRSNQGLICDTISVIIYSLLFGGVPNLIPFFLGLEFGFTSLAFYITLGFSLPWMIPAICFMFNFSRILYHEIDKKIKIYQFKECLKKNQQGPQVMQWALKELNHSNQLPPELIIQIGSFVSEHPQIPKTIEQLHQVGIPKS